MTWTIVVAAVITIIMLAAGGAMTNFGAWYRNLHKPSWNPPDWLFGPGWTLILGLAAWAGVLGWTRATMTSQHVLIAVLFSANIVLHTLWSPLFFNLQRPDWALMEVPFLWLSILALIDILGCDFWGRPSRQSAGSFLQAKRAPRAEDAAVLAKHGLRHQQPRIVERVQQALRDVFRQLGCWIVPLKHAL